MKEELTTKMHSEFAVSRDIEIRHKVGCVIEIALKMNKKATKDVIDIAKDYGVNSKDLEKWKKYWAKRGLKL